MYNTSLHVEFLNRYVVVMAYGGLSTSLSKTLLRWREDLGVYYRHGISPRTALVKKVASKIPQFVTAPLVMLRRRKEDKTDLAQWAGQDAEPDVSDKKRVSLYDSNFKTVKPA